jgi:hypothetical protein
MSAAEVATRVVHMIVVHKTMLTVLLSVHDTIFINGLPPEKKFIRGYFCEQMLRKLSEILHSGRTAGSSRLIVLFDHATSHRSAVTENCFHSYQFHYAPQSPYSTNITPCDFFLFGDLKTKLNGEELEIMDQLQGRVEESLGRVRPETMP